MSKKIYPGYAVMPERDEVVIEHTLKFADIDDIKKIISKYGVQKCREVWEKTMAADQRMRKLNFFLAKFFFKISVDDAEIEDYLRKHSTRRIDRIDGLFNS